MALAKFEPTPESLPPVGTTYRLQTPSGLPVHIHPLNPLAFLLRAALIVPKKLALVHPDTPSPVSYTFEVWTQRVQNLAYALIQAGIRPGDRVAVIAPNSPMMADAQHGVIAARAVLTPVNIRLKPSEVAYIIEHSEARLILVDHEFLHLVKGINVPMIISKDTGRIGDPYEEFLSNGRKFSAEKGWCGLTMESNEDSPAVLCYTSGTTGKPKGVVTTLRGSYLASVANAFETKIDRDSVYLWILPMFHAAGWTFPWSCTFAWATQITIRIVDFNLIWKHLPSTTHFCAAPTVLIGIVNHPGARRLATPVKAIIAGAAPTPHLIGELEKKGVTPIHVYGLTETYGPFTQSYAQPSWKTLSLKERARLNARQGHSFATADHVRVVSARDLQEGKMVDVIRDGQTVGEIVTRGNIVMKEYFRDPEATRKAFQGGYFHSGDLAVMHPDGAVAIVDRSKDIIISGGENASSLAIEEELATHPHVLEVSVVARPHPKWGERPMAYVILHPDHSGKWKGKHSNFAKELKAFARERLPGFSCPEWIEVVEELPKTSTGKIRKNELRSRVAKL